MIAASFAEPLVREIAAGIEEKVYGFSRRCVFSPEITDNRCIRCCAVSGPGGAQSAGHTHPGDEVVISLGGENRNSVGGRSLSLERGQAIAVPPETPHSTAVTGADGWRGISFYCDRCPFIGQNHVAAADLRATVKPLEMGVFGTTADLHSHVLFSPRGRETAFMEISLLGGTGKRRREVLHRGESVYVLLRGQFTLSWSGGESLLQPGTAAAVPAGLPHRLGHDDPSESLLAVCSCSSCSLAGFGPVLD